VQTFKLPPGEKARPVKACVFKMMSSDDERDDRFPLVNPSIQHPIYVKAYPLRDPTDVPRIKAEIIEGNILIVKITPIAKRSVEETKSAISELVDFIKSIQGDIARLGEERIVMTPPTVKVWRGKENSALTVAAAGSRVDEETE
jgi:SepF-like predicted cell division protein (DUF552 family)